MKLAKPLLKWFAQHGRHDLPWQTGQAYDIWLSEIMLQQTQVNTVIPYFHKFKAAFPTLQALANAPLDDVLARWAGLGYYARARNGHKTAQTIMTQFAGQFPKDVETLMRLPGIGRSTAGAIVAQAYAKPAPILDGNVKRVLARFHEIPGWPGHSKTANQLWHWAEQHTPTRDVAAYTQAIMDLGATLCTRQAPACHQCPLHKHCQAYQHHTVTQYPHKKPAKTLPKKHVRWLILSTQDGRILLEKCLQRLWGGLWIFPHCAIDIEPKHYLVEHYCPTIHAEQSLAPLVHTFSHFQLHIQPVLFLIGPKPLPTANRVAGQAPLRWIKLSQIDTLAVPAPVKKVLRALE